MTRYLLDTWALLALTKVEEPAASRVQELIDAAIEDQCKLYMTLINLGEAYYIVGQEEDEDAAKKLVETVRLLPVELVPADEREIFNAAHYKLHHKISYADGFAVAAAVQHDAIVLTGDPGIFALSDIVQIEPLTRDR